MQTKTNDNVYFVVRKTDAATGKLDAKRFKFLNQAETEFLKALNDPSVKIARLIQYKEHIEQMDAGVEFLMRNNKLATPPAPQKEAPTGGNKLNASQKKQLEELLALAN